MVHHVLDIPVQTRHQQLLLQGKEYIIGINHSFAGLIEKIRARRQ